jgi:hypothetical protein
MNEAAREGTPHNRPCLCFFPPDLCYTPGKTLQKCRKYRPPPSSQQIPTKKSTDYTDYADFSLKLPQKKSLPLLKTPKKKCPKNPLHNFSE